MPSHGLSKQEAEDLAAYLVRTPRSLSEPSRAPEPVARVERDVFYEEVEERVLRRSCYHCHADPDFSMGDEGPGNEGGFGFLGVGLNLANYEGVAGGAYPGGLSVQNSLFAERERLPIFDIDAPAASRLLRALRARRIEEQGGTVPGVRGMPLGLPALAEEEIALVEAWITQGARY